LNYIITSQDEQIEVFIHGSDSCHSRCGGWIM